MTWLVLLLACEPVHVTCERPREDEEASSTRAPDGSLPVDTGTAPVDSTPPAATDTAGVLVDSGTTAVLDDTAQPVVGEVDCGGVGASDTDGFFELVGFDGRLYAGQFGYGQEHRSMLYRTDPWELTSPGLTGVSESVCAMVEHDGWLYANTESSGDIQRSADGAHWDRVLDGESGTIGCGITVHDGVLYAVTYDNQDRRGGLVRRSEDGVQWTTVYDSGDEALYLREIVSHRGEVHAFATDEATGQGWWLRSVDGFGWSRTPTPSRFFRAYDDGDTLWVGSSSRTSTGVAGVWRIDDGQTPQLVHETHQAYVTRITRWRGALWAGTSAGWKDDQGPADLLVSRDEGASWQVACTVPETAIWSIATVDDRLYVGTWDYGGTGALLEVVER